MSGNGSKGGSPRSALKQITSEARGWPAYMKTSSSASKTSTIEIEDGKFSHVTIGWKMLSRELPPYFNRDLRGTWALWCGGELIDSGTVVSISSSSCDGAYDDTQETTSSIIGADMGILPDPPEIRGQDSSDTIAREMAEALDGLLFWHEVPCASTYWLEKEIERLGDEAIEKAKRALEAWSGFKRDAS